MRAVTWIPLLMVEVITEELCGHEFSSAAISRIVGQLDAQLKKCAKRRLVEPYPYLC